MKAVMYHYIREYDRELPNFRYLDFKNFQKQLDFFSSNFGFLTRQELDKLVRNVDCESSRGKILLTFDDATACHYHYVFPELEKRGLWGIFYIPSAPYLQKKLLDVHIVHMLCGKHNGKELLMNLLKLVEAEMLVPSEQQKFNFSTYTTQKNFDGVTEFKKIINYFIEPKFRGPILDALLKMYGIKADSSNFYMKLDELKKIDASQSILGAHTVNHPVMSKLVSKEQEKEIKGSFDFLNTICTPYYKTYCHPFGGNGTFNNETLKLLELEKVNFSFCVNPRKITKNDWKENSHSLPRFDCNQFNFGSAS